ncbi:hypothetical protein HK096_001191, partial [Nowakowskiella sp. JEL0078]
MIAHKFSNDFDFDLKSWCKFANLENPNKNQNSTHVSKSADKTSTIFKDRIRKCEIALLKAFQFELNTSPPELSLFISGLLDESVQHFKTHSSFYLPNCTLPFISEVPTNYQLEYP